MVQWLVEQGVRDLVPDEKVERAYKAFSRCPFGKDVTPALKTRFFRRLAPYVDHLAIKSDDLGRFRNPQHVHHIKLRDETPID